MAFDPDYGKTGFARRLFRLRYYEHELSQAGFAELYGIPVGTLKDLEQGRTKPSSAMLLWVATIEAKPRLARSIAAAKREELASYSRSARA